MNEIVQLVEENDKIIIFCSNNYRSCLEDIEAQVGFYEQILEHPILSRRVIFSVNVCPTQVNSTKKIGELVINGHQIPFKKCRCSNYPGETFQGLCLSAVGANIVSGDRGNHFIMGSGTSEAAPVITSLATLVKQKFPEMTGIEVVQRLKDTARPLGDPKITGCGYIWAPAALGIETSMDLP